MNVLVLGASSAVGAGVAEAFSPGNRLLLTGRDASRLGRAVERCRAAGACDVSGVAWDLRKGIGELGSAARGFRPDLVINAASATSRLRDDQVAPGEMEGHLAVDLTVPLDLVRSLLPDQVGRPFGVVFISTVLSAVRSPGREIYGSLKRVHEKALLGLSADRPDFRLLIVRVSKRIPADAESIEARKLGRAVLKGYLEGKRFMYHGVAGRLAKALYGFHPILFSLAVRAGRYAHGRSSTSF